MVRLKDRKGYIKRGNRINFNSTMVRLKADQVDLRFAVTREFQFHYGTIKSALPLLDYITSGTFQFHYGTIKRVKANVKKCMRLPHFNSTMVRLKAVLG